MSHVSHVTQQTLDQDVLQSPVPVVIDFHANWCGPCRAMSPILDRLAIEFAGRVKIVKINIDTEAGLARQYRVASIPHLVFVAGGKVIGQTSGVIPEASLRGALQQLVA